MEADLTLLALAASVALACWSVYSVLAGVLRFFAAVRDTVKWTFAPIPGERDYLGRRYGVEPRAAMERARLPRVDVAVRVLGRRRF